ncbi:MAG: TrmH family RNA methyltransferase [Burkholderiaceae bacterium]
MTGEIADAMIDSTSNDSFRRLVRLLQSSRDRRREQRSVIEGVHLVDAFLQATQGAHTGQTPLLESSRIHWLFVPTERFTDPEILDLIKRMRANQGSANHADRPRVLGLSATLFKKVSQLEQGYGPIAVIDTPSSSLPEQLHGDCVYLDRIQDPGNMGSILRTAAAAGIRHVLASPGTAFAWAPKVLRAGMGAHFALRITEGVPFESLTAQLLSDLSLCALVAPGQAQEASALHEVDLSGRTLWLFGNEGQGLDPSLLADSRLSRITIDQAEQVESMNVAAAAAVALFEQRRQRLIRLP